MRKMKGFTLVELLVVMAIIAFLTIGSFAGLTFGLRQARDTQRRNIVTQVNTALLSYYADFQKYPSNYGCTSAVGTSGFYRCTSAMSGTAGLVFSSGSAGVGDYIEGRFNWGPYGDPGTGSNDTKIGFYVNTSSTSGATKFGVCSRLENLNSGNVNTLGTTTKDCFCQGNDTNTFACDGLPSLQ